MVKISLVALSIAMSLTAALPAVGQMDETSVSKTGTVQQPSDYALSTADFFPEKTQTESTYIEAESPSDAIRKINMVNELRKAGIHVGTMAKVNYGPCKIVAAGFHARESGNYETGGFKSTTYCTQKVSSIKHSSQARFKRLAWWVKGGPEISESTTKIKPGKYKKISYPTLFTQKNHQFSCKSSKRTTWSGRTLGTIVYKGKTYYADAYAPVQKDVPCRL